MRRVLLGVFDGEAAHLSIAVRGQRPLPGVALACRSAADITAAIDAFLNDQGRPEISAAAFCAPGPEVNGVIEVMDSSLRLDRADLRGVIGVQRVHLLNDFTACALAISHLDSAEVVQLGGKAPAADSPLVALGPWQWLGVGVLAPETGDEPHPLSACGGHCILAANDEREAEILAWLRRDFGGPVRASQVISKPGMANVNRALAAMAGARPLGSFEAVLDAAKAGDGLARETIAAVTAWQGSLAGDLALTVGARGGVYLFSPALAAMPDLFDRDLLRSRFEDKGALKPYMQTLPLFIVSTPEPRLMGLSTLFET